jgi:hypothetical protein
MAIQKGLFSLTERQSITEGYVPPIHDFTMEKTVLTLKEFEAPKSY